MRVVRTPSGGVALDETGRAAGRGAYICRIAACLDRAISKGALSRALKTPLPTDLRDTLAGSQSTNTMNDIIEGGARGQE
jgi:predicted RNA-binding protein YlxR (DUF448 family)